MTTASLPRVEPPAAATAAGPKRRRRAPTTGAAEDCHSCRKRQTPCDRRRPYCSQCVELGKECSGYRTTLTWGVGVASRGKLRGMTLPVASASSAPSAEHAKSPVRERPQPSLSTEAQRPRKRTKSVVFQRPEEPLQQRPPLHPQHPTRSLDTGHAFPRTTTTTTSSTADWWQPSSFGGPYSTASSAPSMFHHVPVNAAMLGSPIEDGAMSSSADSIHSSMSIGPYMDQSYDSIPDQSSPPDMDVQFLRTHVPSSHVQTPVTPYVTSPFDVADLRLCGYFWQPPVSAAPSSSVESGSGFLGTDLGGWTSALQAEPQAHQAHSWHDEPPLPLVVQMHNEDETAHDVLASPLATRFQREPTFTITPGLTQFNLTPRIRSLIEFYDKAICPVLVAFDDASNPYRKHILPLVLQHEGLQNALAALATNNMRMRNLKRVPSFKHWPEQSAREVALAIGRPSTEEQKYKTASIERLNAQLADPMLARDDGVLATLLILCLFHVCDTGFSRFKTQLAGVQKLLRLRGQRWRSEFVDWVEMFFAWFDVMTSAVNDRETEIKGNSLDLSNLTSDLGSLEQFSGCDGRLFKIIARLGRLNLLAQGRSVQPGPEDTPPSKHADYYSLASHASVDCAINPSVGTSPDARHRFWREWQDIRMRLQTWESDPFDAGAFFNSPTPGHSDMMHISEAFRYSALLYTERLAHPEFAPSNPCLQHYVNKSMFHIQAIDSRSCVLKFMLWPIFITGTECVSEQYRDTIRGMCVDIQQESGFYNNVSGLEVLERVWKDIDEGRAQQSPGQALHWRNAMRRVDGEYIVI